MKSDTTEPICLECEIHLIGSPGLFQSPGGVLDPCLGIGVPLGV